MDASCCKSIVDLALSNERRRFYIAYSGGIDSHVLLHCCASIAELKPKLVAVYIHHGLQVEADAWALHCNKTAQDLGVDFLTLPVNAHPSRGESPEEAARNARYQALQSLITKDDVLLLAQHQEDQLETVLLQLFRGTGLSGLSGMAQQSKFGLGIMLRPLLTTPKQLILEYAHRHQLHWVEDPSNQSNDYDRNYLRNSIVPLLKQRWPVIDKTVSRSANHCANAQKMIDEIAKDLFTNVFDPTDNTLAISRLMNYSPLHQQLIIRYWFWCMGLKMPTEASVKQILHEVIEANGYREIQGYHIRRYRDKLYCVKPLTENYPDKYVWPSDQSSINVNSYCNVMTMVSSKGILAEQWTTSNIELRARKGGEKISLPGRQGHHSLKKLFQEAGIPPWERDRIPLVYLDNTLAAVGDLWVSSLFYTEKTEACVRLVLQNSMMPPKRS